VNFFFGVEFLPLGEQIKIRKKLKILVFESKKLKILFFTVNFLFIYWKNRENFETTIPKK